MVKEFIHGQMAVDMKVNTKWIKNTDMEFTNGQMVEYMKAVGIMVNNMGRVNICCKMEPLKLENGKTEREHIG
jgi:hypothetical protein